MKKIIPVFIIAVFLSACSSFNISDITKIAKKPEAKIEKFDIDSITLKDITFLFNVGIKNPYPIGLKLEDIKTKVMIEGKQFFQTSTKKGFKIKAMGKTTTSVKVNLKYTDIVRIIRYYTQKDYLQCTLETVIVIPLPKILHSLKKNISFKYTLKKKIPAIKPTIKIVNFKVEMPSLNEITKSLKKSTIDKVNPSSVFDMFNKIISGEKIQKIIDPTDIDVPFTVSFNIELENKTKAKLYFKSLNYDFYVNDSKLIEGETSRINSVGNKSIIAIKNKFSSRALGEAIIKAFRYKKGSYSLKGISQIKLPDSIKREPLALNFNEKGQFNLR